jgi:hypothetical protein
MSYGLRYKIIQKLRDETDLVCNIYLSEYTDTIITNYQATSIQIQPNSSNDEPLPTILSSQLNISFVISTQNDFDNFPVLLSTDDRKYYVELVNNSNIMWVGFLFNDYVKIPFTTGYLEVDLIAIDGISFLQSIPYKPAFNESVNDIQTILKTIADGLNLINYPTQLLLLTSCSYYAASMLNRGDSTNYEPFNQTYQYRRDYLGQNYYDIINNIITSFGCRLFQADGMWQIININEIAESTRYFTTYIINPSISISVSGILNKQVTIQPYVLNNVHFINNSQNKLIRKGYNLIELDGKMTSATNYVHNGDFKIFDLSLSNPLSGWTFASYGTYSSANFVQLNDNSNSVELISGTASSDYAYLQIGASVAPTYFKPFMVRPSFTLSFDGNMGGGSSGQNGLVEISLLSTTGTTYYYNSSNNWQNTQTFYTIINNQSLFGGIYQNISINVLLTYPNVPGSYAYEGYIGIKFYANSTHQSLRIKNVKITQQVAFPTSLVITNQISNSKSTLKTLSQPYGISQNTSIAQNFTGLFYNSYGNYLNGWYRYGKTESFQSLQFLMAKEYSNLLNKNFATLESDLGAFQSSVGMITLDKVYLVEDSTSDVLTYNNKKFIANRLNITPQQNETTSFQLVEVSNVDLDTTQIIIYS